MKLSEQIRADREKLKKLPDRNSRLRFIWDYYKYPLLFVSTVLVILLVSFISNIGKADINLYVVLLNNDSPIVECDESVFKDTMNRAGIDMNRKRVDVNKDLSLGMGTTEATDMETLQVLTALFSISDLDPSAEIKNSKPAMISDFLRPRLVARNPEMAEPMIHPIRDEAEVKPCHPSV